MADIVISAIKHFYNAMLLLFKEFRMNDGI